MAPQERTTYEQEDESRPNSTIDNLSNIDLAFVNKGYQNDSTDIDRSNVASNNNVEEKKKKATDFDDILPYIGEFGLYQKILFLLMIPFAFFVAFVYFSQIFMTIAPEQHWCWVPELANLTVEER
ncbi:Uncharacterized protein OBRU01_05338 [Operophtera brumata]|uniref:Uncharacterized protein n=1 Tax=Operophtera brumata TaxID=104452 RepID=A0A0L7LN20_OPEBR|nr:Uncharacterized protein OBRU01_05338 [Operophtera brumata]